MKDIRVTDFSRVCHGFGHHTTTESFVVTFMFLLILFFFITDNVRTSVWCVDVLSD